MLRLLKFEILKKWKMSVGVLVAYFILLFAFYFKFKSDGTFSIETFGLQLVFFVVLGSALFIFSMIGAVNNLRLEAKQSTRDLYFSIPMTSYVKIGSKVIVSMIEVAAAAIIAGVSATKAIESLTNTKLLSKFFKEIFDLAAKELSFLISFQFIQSILALLIVYLSFALFRTFFSQIKFGGIITIVIYIALNYGMARLVGLVVSVMEGVEATNMTPWLLLTGFTLFTAGVFALIGYLFENRVSFD